LSLFVAALDQTIIATAVPTIVFELKSASGYVWIGGAYLLANAAAGPIWAKLSDIWGRKPILLAAVALFFCSSMLCALSVNIKMLIIGRAIQGTACGRIMQMVIITISDLFSMRCVFKNSDLSKWNFRLMLTRSRSLYLGLLEVMWAIAGGIGPVLGGAFTQKASWRWNFWINLPISGSTFIMLLIFLDVHNPRTSMKDGFKAIDWFGSLSILALTLMLLLGLEFGGATFPWKSPQVICLIIFGSLMSIFFLFSEKRLARYPLMPLDLFRKKSNVACLMVGFFQGMVFIGGEYYLPLYFQSVMQASPLHSGVLILPITITEALMGITVGVLIHRTGRYLELIYLGVALMTVGNGLYTLFSATSSLASVIGFQVIAGIGAGALFEAPLLGLQAFVSQHDTATATGTFGFVRNLATSLSIVIGGVIFQNSMDLQVASLASPPLNLPSNVTSVLSGGAAAANVMIVATIQDPAQQFAVKEAFAWSLRNMWIFYTAISGLAVVASAFIKRQVLSKEHVETRTGIRKEESPMMEGEM